MNASIPILSVVIGAVVLLFGRKLFWLCVAAIGFAAGVTLASHLVSEPTPLLQLTFAILLGFIGALLALFLQKLAIGLAGFLAGGRLAVGLVATFMRSVVIYGALASRRSHSDSVDAKEETAGLASLRRGCKPRSH